MLSPNFAARHPQARARVNDWLDATTSDVLSDELAAAALSEDLTPRLGELGALPILARGGELDQAAPVAFSEAIAKSGKNATLEIVAGAGHALLVEDEEGSIDSVLRFLSDS